MKKKVFETKRFRTHVLKNLVLRKKQRLHCRVPLDQHVIGYGLRNSPNAVLYHHHHPAHKETKRFFYDYHHITVVKGRIAARELILKKQGLLPKKEKKEKKETTEKKEKKKKTKKSKKPLSKQEKLRREEKSKMKKARKARAAGEAKKKKQLKKSKKGKKSKSAKKKKPQSLAAKLKTMKKRLGKMLARQHKLELKKRARITKFFDDLKKRMEKRGRKWEERPDGWAKLRERIRRKHKRVKEQKKEAKRRRASKLCALPLLPQKFTAEQRQAYKEKKAKKLAKKRSKFPLRRLELIKGNKKGLRHRRAMWYKKKMFTIHRKWKVEKLAKKAKEAAQK